MSDRIPEENLYRRLRETLDLSFLYKDTKELYGRTGNPSIDPVIFFKLLITGYLISNNLFYKLDTWVTIDFKENMLHRRKGT